MSTTVISLLVSFTVTYVIIRYQSFHASYSHDHDLRGVQKFHTESVPRIGGLALLAGILVADPPIWLLLSALPVFSGGLLEDFTNRVSPKNRLLLAFLSAAIAFYELDIGLKYLGLDWFDSVVLSIPGFSLALTILMVGGVSHATNIIDGFNGLLLGFALAVLLVFGLVVWQLDDQFLLSLILPMIGSLLGLLFFNFPRGKIFTGDGGAYLIGFMLAILSLMLVARHKEVSPWFPLLVLSYPVFETIFSIYRRKYLKGLEIGQPDAIHLHTLVYRRLIPRYFSVSKKGWKRNAFTAVVMWIFVLPPLLSALLWWSHQWVMMLGVVVFCFYYIWFYFRIVRFNVMKRTGYGK